MERLLEAVAAVVSMFSPEKVRAIASRVRQTDLLRAATDLLGVVGTPAASVLVDRLVSEWKAAPVGASELASMLLSASHVFEKTAARQATELVWTGPTTPFVSTRRTEQALLEVINAANATLFITSFVTYDVSFVVNALNAASGRGVDVSLLLESSQEHGGNISIDGIGKMRAQAPSARLFAWRRKEGPFANGSMHAKLAVADDSCCFITSANLTGYAMERNMEAGVLITGGPIPISLRQHLYSLIDTHVIAPV